MAGRKLMTFVMGALSVLLAPVALSIILSVLKVALVTFMGFICPGYRARCVECPTSYCPYIVLSFILLILFAAVLLWGRKRFR